MGSIWVYRYFYPRSPRGERLFASQNLSPFVLYFYPRSPRGERLSRTTCPAVERQNFYPRSPRGERQKEMQHLLNLLYFYPRSPRGERQPKHVKTGKRGGFLSTLPARGATRILADLFVDNEISIHAPREGSDLLITDMVLPSCYFYPRSPRGERPDKVAVGEITLKFLSTLPARGATQRRPPAPPAERFLSTLPARGATISPPSLGVAGGFLSTLPARGATPRAVHPGEEQQRFLSTLPARGATIP